MNSDQPKDSLNNISAIRPRQNGIAAPGPTPRGENTLGQYTNDSTADRDAGTGGQEGQPPPLPFTRRGKWGKGALSI